MMEDCLKLIAELDTRHEQIDDLQGESRRQVQSLREMTRNMRSVELDKLVRQCHNSVVYQEVLSEQRQRLHWEAVT